MLRSGLMLLTLCSFLLAVGLGVIISNERFNRMVLPTQPVKLYHFAKQENGDLEIEIIGERITVNPGSVIEKTEPYWQIAKQKLDQQMPALERLVVEHWENLQQSERLKAVNQWVQDKVKERI